MKAKLFLKNLKNLNCTKNTSVMPENNTDKEDGEPLSFAFMSSLQVFC